MNETHQHNINVMAYEIDRVSWTVEWMADNHQDLQNELIPLQNKLVHFIIIIILLFLRMKVMRKVQISDLFNRENLLLHHSVHIYII